MARTPEEVRTDLAASAQAIDESIEVKKGPVYNFMIQPVGGEVAGLESRQDRISQLNSLEFVSAATEDEILAVGNNWGMERGGGTFSTTTCYFMRFTRPALGEVNAIPIGSLCANINNTYVYRTIEEASIDGDNADAFYNANRKAYEVPVQVEAVAVGSEYDIPAYRIIRILTPITGLDAVENRVEAKGGSSQEATTDYVNRIYDKFEGTDKGTTNGIESVTKNSFPENIKDLSIIRPKDRTLFKRPVSSPALDIYMIGVKEKTFTQNYIATGGETEIALEYKPVVSIESLRVNLVGTSFTLLEETGLKYAGSIYAADKIVLSSPLNANDQVEIKGTYNRLIEDVQNLYSEKELRLFETDIVAKKSIKRYLHIEIKAGVISSKEPEKAEEEIASKLIELVEPGVFIASLYPEIIKENILSSVSGLTSFSFVYFTTVLSSNFQVEVVELELNEEAKVDLTLLRIDVTK